MLTGQCVELGAEGLPLAPLVDALRTLARAMPPDVLAGVLGPAAPGLSRLLPELAPLTAGGASGGVLAASAGEDMQKAQLLEHVLGTLGRLSSVAPVLFTVEDVHWADRSTLDLVAFLFRSLRRARVMIVVTYRSDELHRRHPLRPLLTSWERDRSIDRVDLRRFDRDEVAAQLHAILGEAPGPAVTETVFDRSGGNAYLVEELAGTVKAHGDPADLPPSLADVLLSRVDALTPDAQKLLRTASVAGPGGAGPAAGRGGGTRRGRAVRALREAVDGHLLVVDQSGHGYAFRHALTRDAVYEDMLPGERVRLHAAYAAALDRDQDRRRRGGQADGVRARLPLVRGARPAAGAACVDRCGRARDGPVRARRGTAPPGTRAGDLAPGRGRATAHRHGPGRRQQAGRRSRVPVRGAGPGSVAARRRPGGACRGRPTRSAEALLLERYAMVQRDRAPPTRRRTLRRALGLLPPD